MHSRSGRWEIVAGWAEDPFRTGGIGRTSLEEAGMKLVFLCVQCKAVFFSNMALPILFCNCLLL